MGGDFDFLYGSSADNSQSNWADINELENDEIANLDNQIAKPAVAASEESYETEVDSNGIKTVVQFTTNKRGQKVKVTKKVKVEEQEILVPKAVIERRKLKKFGKVAGFPPGPEEGKTELGEEIFVLETREGGQSDKKGAKQEETFQLNIVCRKCGKVGDHWTSKCPYRDQLGEDENMGDVMDAKAAAAGEDGGDGTSASGTPGAYVPPRLRAGADGSRPSYRERDDACTVRVTNISEDTKEADLHDLFRPFGHTTRVYLAKNRQTGLSRGFAYVTYDRRDDAAKAIKALNGFGYDHLILKCEWAQPSSK